MDFMDAIYNELRETQFQQTIHLSIDKIGLRIDSRDINKKRAKDYQKGTITILLFGNTAQINIHAEFRSYLLDYYKKIEYFVLECYDAIEVLRNDGVFTRSFERMYDNLKKAYYDKDNELGYKYRILNTLFALAELEIAFDFFDLPVFVKPNKKEHTNFRVCRGTTFYTLDWRQPRRMIDGKMISKGRQQSFLCIYDKSKKFKMEKNIQGYKQKMTRLEMRYQGKYKRYLSMDLLIGNEEFILYRLLKPTKKILKKLITPEDIAFCLYWLDPYCRNRFMMVSNYLEYLFLDNEDVNPARYDYTPEEEVVDAILSYSCGVNYSDINNSIPDIKHEIETENTIMVLSGATEEAADSKPHDTSNDDIPDDYFDMDTLDIITSGEPDTIPFRTSDGGYVINSLEELGLTAEILEIKDEDTGNSVENVIQTEPEVDLAVVDNLSDLDRMDLLSISGNTIWDTIDLTGDNPVLTNDREFGVVNAVQTAQADFDCGVVDNLSNLDRIDLLSIPGNTIWDTIDLTGDNPI